MTMPFSRVIASITLVAGLFALTGCVSATAGGGIDSTDGSGPPTSTPTSSSSASADAAGLPLRVAVVGDSNSTGFKTMLADGIKAGVAWIAMVPQSEIKFAGGWARSGATSTAMRQNANEVPDADVLVIMAGTNNIAMGLPVETLDEDLRAISETVGATHTVIAGIAPFDARPEDATALNAHLTQLAAAEGWTYIDPWTELRQPDGKWVREYLADGLHTTRPGYQVMALALRDQLLAFFAPDAAPTPAP